ncbi:MAG: hypothetical protein ACREDR_05430, partial [Blastocatellia bacterium]
MVVEPQRIIALGRSEQPVDRSLAAALAVMLHVISPEATRSWLSEVVLQILDAQQFAGFALSCLRRFRPDKFKDFANAGEQIVHVCGVVNEYAVRNEAYG